MPQNVSMCQSLKVITMSYEPEVQISLTTVPNPIPPSFSVLPLLLFQQKVSKAVTTQINGFPQIHLPLVRQTGRPAPI